MSSKKKKKNWKKNKAPKYYIVFTRDTRNLPLFYLLFRRDFFWYLFVL